ncbi:MAG: ChrR family anti-sigma-E factor [Aestuariivirgaceae bacterium]|nr:ChrR family anti-sigma-E factor [Aestuariivirgaceae bacterium]
MTIRHHLDEATILAYAAGTLNEAFSLVAAAHVSVCKTCRAAVRHAEAVGGCLMEDTDAVAVTPDARARMMAQLDVVAPLNTPERPRPMASHELPRPLARLLGGSSLDEIRWRALAPGIAVHDLPLSPQARGHLKLLRIGAGKTMPEHGHGGEEITLILKGAYRDKFGEFRAGDVADLDESMEHSPVVTDDGPCICLIATEAPTRMKGLFARMLQPWFGI